MKTRLLISVSIAALLCSAVAVHAQTYEQNLDQVAQTYGMTRSDLSTETQTLVKQTMDANTAFKQADDKLSNATENVSRMNTEVTNANSHVAGVTGALKSANDALTQAKAQLAADQKIYSNSKQLQQNLNDAVAKQKTAEYWANEAAKAVQQTANLPPNDPRRQAAVSGNDNAIKLLAQAQSAALKAADDVKSHGLATLQNDQAAINAAQTKAQQAQNDVFRTQDEVHAAQANLLGAVQTQKTAQADRDKAFATNVTAAQNMLNAAKNDEIKKIAKQQTPPPSVPKTGGPSTPGSVLANQPSAPPLANAGQPQTGTPATGANNGGIASNNAPVVSNDGGSVLSHDGGTLINHDGASVVGHNASAVVGPGGASNNGNGAGVVGPGGASRSGTGAGLVSDVGSALAGTHNANGLVTDNGSALVGNAGGTLIGELGGALTGNKAASLISNNANGIVINQGSNIVTDQGAGLVHLMTSSLQTTTPGSAIFKQNSTVTAFTNVETPSDQLKRGVNNLSGADIKTLQTLQKQVDGGQTLSPADQAKVQTIWTKATRTLDKGTVQQLDNQAKQIAAVEATHKANTQVLGAVIVQHAVQSTQDPVVAAAANKAASGQTLTADEAKRLNTAVNKVVSAMPVPTAQRQALTQSANARVVTLATPKPAPVAAPAQPQSLSATQAQALQQMQQMRQDALRKGDTASAAAMAKNIEALQKVMSQPPTQATAPAAAPTSAPQSTHAPAAPTLASAPPAAAATNAAPHPTAAPSNATIHVEPKVMPPAVNNAVHIEPKKAVPAAPVHPVAKVDIPEKHMPRAVIATPHTDVKITAPKVTPPKVTPPKVAPQVHAAAPKPPQIKVVAPKAPTPPPPPGIGGIRH